MDVGTSNPAGGAVTTGRPLPRTIGVEEELLLVDAGSLLPAAAALTLLRDAGAADVTDLHGEFKQEQVELTSQPWRDLDELSTDLRRLRTCAADLAAERGLLLVAAGTYPGPVTPTPMPGRRYRRIAAEFRDQAAGQLTCGTHIHVAVDSRAEGVAVLDRVRPWLAVLTALAGNSPFWQGRDTGFASYRSIVLGQLPTSGPSPVWGGVAEYDRVRRSVIDIGAAFDPAMIYYDVRLSARYPTVEFRVPDITPEVGDAVLLAALCRGLVDMAARTWRQGIAPDDVAMPILQAARWRAARHGMSDALFDPVHHAVAPAWQVLHSLVDHVEQALAVNGDGETVQAGIARVCARGTGADLQRARASTGTWGDVSRTMALPTGATGESGGPEPEAAHRW